ncbi:MAG: lysyl oxidase family protein [Solirubrobacteraceae bacterium]
MALVSVGAFAAGLPPAAAGDLLPNLVADPPANAELDVNMGQLLLRFDGFVHNAGPGPFEVRGQRATTSEPMVAYQRIYQDATLTTYRDARMPGAQFVYAANDGHQHWHLQNVAAYSLWNFARTQRVAPAEKVGFCMADSEHVDMGVGPTNPVYTDGNGRNFCEKNNPAALSVWEGVSAGWRDLYEKTLVFQWVDVTDVQPGVYWLREDVDPSGFVFEASPDRKPAYALTPSTIPGFSAKPVALGPVAVDAPTAITLGADHYGITGARQFRVDSLPAHGTLSVASGTLFTDPHITYRPNPGYRGPDSFSYVARDDASSYPHHPAQATVSLNVGPLPPPVVAPVNASPPTITGTVQAGQKLSASTGSWTGTHPLSYAYHWQLCHPRCANVTGATSSSYTPGAGDVGGRIAVVVTAGNSAGHASAASGEVGPVRSAPLTARQMKASLVSGLGRAGRARIVGLLRAGHYTSSFTALARGRLRISWWLLPTGRQGRRGSRPVLVAIGQLTFSHAGTARITVKLSAAGRTLLHRAPRIRLTVRGSFTPTGAPAIVASQVIVLRR